MGGEGAHLLRRADGTDNLEALSEKGLGNMNGDETRRSSKEDL